MFGPSESILGKSFGHHRSRAFKDLFDSVTKRFRDKFQIPRDYEILFVTGSGTLANEIVIKSLGPLYVVTQGEFSDRLRRLNKYHYPKSNAWNIWAGVQYETAESKLKKLEVPFPYEKEEIIYFADAISAFPYYGIPEAEVWTTVASKQLHGPTGLSIIVVQEDLINEELLRENDESAGSTLELLDLSYMARFRVCPHTPNMLALNALNSILMDFDPVKEKEKIDIRRKWLEAIVPKEAIIGEGPVFTIKGIYIPDEFVDVWGLYIGGLKRENYRVQIFLWSGDNLDYKDFCKELKKAILCP